MLYHQVAKRSAPQKRAKQGTEKHHIGYKRECAVSSIKMDLRFYYRLSAVNVMTIFTTTKKVTFAFEC